jgi:hypothetical protein
MAKNKPRIRRAEHKPPQPANPSPPSAAALALPDRQRLALILRALREMPPSASPYLRIPPPQPAGAPFWENFAISLDAPTAVAGVPVGVKVTIMNCGALPALAVVADFRWSTPSFGFDERSLFPIGRSLPRLLGKGTAMDFECTQPWIPGAGGGDECLMVTCWALNDSQNLQAWQPQIERRCAQHNITVAVLPAGSMKRLSVAFSNLLPMRVEHTVLGAVQRVTAPLPTLERVSKAEIPARVLAAVGPVAASWPAGAFVPQPAALGVRARLSKALGTIGAAGANRSLGNLLLASDQAPQAATSPAISNMSVLHQVTLHPSELRNVEVDLAAPAGSRRGEFFVYRLAQVSEGLLLGGYTAIVQVE